MRNLYLIFFFCSFVLVSQVRGQCLCSDGSTPGSLSYSQYFDSIIATNTTISFPQFDASIGTLKCIRVSDTVTTVVSYNLQNDLNYLETYNFETFRRSQFTGPGGFLSSVTSTPKDYGPYTLAAKDDPGDNVDIGPDTVFNKKFQSKYGSTDPAYYGTGTVNFNYLTTSTFTILTGSDNAVFKLRAYTRLFVMLTYFWCPMEILASGIADFNLVKEGDVIKLDWNTSGETEPGEYVIEWSADGITFNTASAVEKENSNADYSFNVGIPEAQTNVYFFRIRREDKSGIVHYSAVKMIQDERWKSHAIHAYPNPVTDYLNIELPGNGGAYQISVVNNFGQAVFNKSYNMPGAGKVNIAWPQNLSPGIYFVKVKDVVTGKAQSARVLVKK